jgi:hypothetical protein
MVVAEILTGIALVQKSVDFIKSNIGTANDIKDIATQIDGFFTGEAQMNKKSGRGMSIAEQFGSVESSATDFIDRKLLEEKRNELKIMINMRFGPTAWDEIIAERASRINEAKEAKRLQRVEARQKQQEIYEIFQLLGYVVVGVVAFIIILVISVKALADGYTYKSKNYTRQQKIHQGILKKNVYVTCRLKKQKVVKDKMACIYEGANKTYELEFADVRVGCPRQYKCIHNPNSKEPNINDVMESLRSITK